jgi:hypothetical protein
VFALFVSTLSVLALADLAPVRAQAGEAALTGEVRDQAGAAIPQAKVRVTRISTSQTFIANANDSGVYAVTNLKPGRYVVSAEAAGFKRFVREGVQLVTGERVRLDVELEAGDVNEVVTISADASPLKTEVSSLGQVVSNRKIVAMPLKVIRA